MNVHAQPQRLGQPPLTPAERVEALMTALGDFEARRLDVSNWRATIGADDAGHVSSADLEWLGRLIGRRLDAQEEVMKLAFALLVDGHLHRCAEILRVETEGRP